MEERSYCIGNTSNDEIWRAAPRQLAAELGHDTAECCCAYNMMKLTRHLFAWTGDVRYADYYERALYNSRLGTQHPTEGRSMYYLPLASGWWKLYGSALDSFWCCTGTGVEEFARTSDSIYFRDAGGIFVNLFIASEARWATRGIRLRQDTSFPSEPRTRLTITVDRPTRVHAPDPRAVLGDVGRHGHDQPRAGAGLCEPGELPLPCTAPGPPATSSRSRSRWRCTSRRCRTTSGCRR